MHRTPIFQLIMLVGFLVHLSGCGAAEVSPAAYQISKALYSACNRQHDDQLLKVEESIAAKLASQDISSREAALLTEIVEQAKQQEWKIASQQAWQILEDQVDW